MNKFIPQNQTDIYNLLITNVVVLKQNLEQNGLTLIIEVIDWIIKYKLINQLQLAIII